MEEEGSPRVRIHIAEDAPRSSVEATKRRSDIDVTVAGWPRS